jgi:hypothetical protein
MGIEKNTVKAGNLKLKLNSKADVFHAEDVAIVEILPEYEDLIGLRRFDVRRTNLFMGKAVVRELHELNIDPKGTVIYGFYQDTLPSDIPSEYIVNIYLRYIEKQPS